MRIKGLPTSIWKGNYAVFFRGKPCPLMQICNDCTYVHPTYFYCANGHVTCMECQTKNKANCEQAPCKTCNGPSSRITIPMKLIEDLDFSCGCGFLGTLLDLKGHKASEAFDEDCETPPEREDPAVIEYKMDLDELEMVSLKLTDDIQTKLDRIRTLYDHYGLEIVDKKRLEDLAQRVELVTRDSELVMEEYYDCQDIHDQIKPMVDAVVSPSTRASFPIGHLLRVRQVSEKIKTRTFTVSLSMRVTEDGHADLHVRASFERGPIDMAGKTLVIRHHDSNGYTVNVANFTVPKDGTIGEQRDESIPGNRFFDDGHKLPKFIHSTYLIGPASRTTKSIHVSAALCP